MKASLTFKAFSAFVVLLFSSLFSDAQVIYRDVIYLKNGSIIKGNVVEIVPNGNIKIETSDGSIFVYKMDEVEKTEKEEIATETQYVESASNNSSDEPRDKHYFRDKGYFIMGRIGPTAKGLANNGDAIDISGGIINGYQINKYISIGIGIETISYAFQDQDHSSVRTFPVFLDTRLYVPKLGRVQPMFFCQFGYSLLGKVKNDDDYSRSYDYSSYFKPTSAKAFIYFGGGIRVAVSNRMSLLVDGGFALQTFEGRDISYDYQNQSYYSGTHSNSMPASLNLSFGVMINLSK